LEIPEDLRGNRDLRFNGREWDLTRIWTYDRETGLFGGGRHVRLFNPDEEVVERVAPVVIERVAPVVEAVSVEYYASLGIGRRGPFETIEDARAAYPLCRRFELRHVMNNGTSSWTFI
jgi:hypothetical protein